MGIKNLWALNVDELLVSDKIKQQLNKKEFEIFFPLNVQMKNIDLLLLDLKNNTPKTIQVKGSRTYSPTKAEIKRYGTGGSAWFSINKKDIFNTKNKVDFFVFVLHNITVGNIKMEMEIDYLIVPIKDLFNICSYKKLNKKNDYNFFIWLDHNDKRVFDFHDNFEKTIDLKFYLNNWELLIK